MESLGPIALQIFPLVDVTKQNLDSWLITDEGMAKSIFLSALLPKFGNCIPPLLWVPFSAWSVDSCRLDSGAARQVSTQKDGHLIDQSQIRAGAKHLSVLLVHVKLSSSYQYYKGWVAYNLYVTHNYYVPSNPRRISTFLIRDFRRGPLTGVLQGQHYMSFELSFGM
jgi:hypothetical protein